MSLDLWIIPASGPFSWSWLWCEAGVWNGGMRKTLPRWQGYYVCVGLLGQSGNTVIQLIILKQETQTSLKGPAHGTTVLPFCHTIIPFFCFSITCWISTSIKILLLLSGHYQGLPPQGSPPWLYTSHSHMNTLTFPQCYHNTLFGPLLYYFGGLCIYCQIWKTRLMGL